MTRKRSVSIKRNRSKSRKRSKSNRKQPIKDHKLEICGDNDKSLNAVKRFVKTKSRKIKIVNNSNNCITIIMPITAGNVVSLMKLEKQYNLNITNVDNKN